MIVVAAAITTAITQPVAVVAGFILTAVIALAAPPCPGPAGVAN